MWISDTSIKRPVFATMVIMSFMVLGIVSLTRLGIDLFPDVNFPFVNVSVVYPGAGPEEVETLVTRPIEDAVAGINGVKRVISTSTEGFARIEDVIPREEMERYAREFREAAGRAGLPPRFVFMIRYLIVEIVLPLLLFLFVRPYGLLGSSESGKGHA